MKDEDEIIGLRTELKGVYNSLSWKVTKPLRFTAGLLRKYLPSSVKDMIRLLFKILRRMIRLVKILFDKNTIKKTRLRTIANRYIQNENWLGAKKAWEEILLIDGDISPEQLMHRHTERGSIALLATLEEHSKIKAQIESRDKKTRNKVAIYTAITGGYDKIKLPTHVNDDYDYHVFTDQPTETFGLYRVHEIPYVDYDKTRSARYVKTHPHLLLPEYEIAIWVDANIIINGDIEHFVKEFKKSKKAIGAIPHPLRDDTYEEAQACINLMKDDEDIISQQAREYERQGFSEPGLIESNFMLFDLRNKKIEGFFRLWWQQINQYSRRDQLSLIYAISQAGLTWHKIIERPYSTRNHDILTLTPHGSNEKLQDIVLGEFANSIENPLPKKNLKNQLVHKTVTAVVCVHNAYEEVKDCLETIEKHKKSNLNLVIIDDGSAEQTRDFLQDFAEKRDWVTRHRNEEAGGYTKAANEGMQLSTGDLTIMLNSDTVPTEGWSDNMLRAINSVPSGGIVGPLSSAASHQSIPNHISSKTQTAVNGLPKGVTIEDMGAYCKEWSSDFEGPTTMAPLVHGFCFGVSRKVLEEVGYLDDKSFPRGYGEETDYCFRAADAGFNLLVTVDTYIFHHKSKSYDNERRIKLMKDGSETLKKIYGEERIARAIKTMQQNPKLVFMRKKATKLYTDN